MMHAQSMHDPVSERYLTGAFCLFLGLLGWILPYRWNILRMRRPFSRLLSDSANMLVPKIVGSAAILGGIVLIVGAALGWEV